MSFWESETYRVIQAMRSTGNQAGVVQRWIEAAAVWAATNDGPDATAIRAWLPLWQARPFYTAAELSPIFPALVVALGISKRPPWKMAPERLAFQLRYGGLPELRNADDSGKFFPPQGGTPARYFIVERIHYWRNQVLSQKEFNDVLLG